MSKFTLAQQQAIITDKKNILVSAAAGSGKTAVLTERILRHISAEGAKQNIDNLLVVTYTEAASAEMKERIAKKLHDAGQTAQIARLPMANISTIHSFCRKLIQEHFQVIGIDPAFKVGDEAELSLIRQQAMDDIFEEEYANENNENFLDLADVYGGRITDGRLDLLIRKIFDFMESTPFPQLTAKRYSNFFYKDLHDLDNTAWAEIVRLELKITLEGAIEGAKQAITLSSLPLGGPFKYVEKLQGELEILQDLYALTDSASFDTLYQNFTDIDWGRLPTITAKDEVDPDLKNQVQDIRNSVVKKAIDKVAKGAFFAPPSKMKDDLSALSVRISTLMTLSIKFAEKFAAEKRARNLLDFSDLEHFAIKILYPNGPEDMTPNFANPFYEVLIDEYQDSNEVQDLILSALAKRRFMVGDVKQSIYRFRRANPKLFLKKYLEYDGTVGTRIDLSHNFRSRPEVLSSVNFFFSQLMCNRVGEIEYDSQAALHQGHKSEEYPSLPDSNTPYMWVELLDQKVEDAQNNENTSDEELEINDDETIDNVVAEARVIAKCILELTNNESPRQVWDSDTSCFRPCNFGDIAILTRGLSSIAGAVIEELKKFGIDAIADMGVGFLDQVEVKTALAFLRIVDNPRQDIDIVTVLRSPVYGFSDDELLAIRMHSIEALDHDICFFDHMLSYDKAKGSEASQLTGDDNQIWAKIRHFLKDLSLWRKSAVHLPISRLLGQIYDVSQYPSYVLTMSELGGALRQANLRLLLEKAIEFEETSLKGLFHFVNYIEKLYESGVRTVGAVAEPMPIEKGRVRLMTIHKSKGLEFPIVFCAFLGKKFNTDDTRQGVILHPEHGVGPYYIDTKLRTRSNTLARFSLSRLTARENLSEELRCLYVAMTRAKELIVLTARVPDLKNAIKKWSSYVSLKTVTLPAYYRNNVKSYLDWVMTCLLRHRSSLSILPANEKAIDLLWNHNANFRIRTYKNEDLGFIKVDNSATKTSIMSDNVEPNKNHIILTPLLASQFAPSKLAISEIKRLYDITADSTNYEDFAPDFSKPNFLIAKEGITAMDIGSALHTVTEHLDYKKHTSLHALNNLIDQLVKKNHITTEMAEHVDREKILTFVSSSLAGRIRNSPKVNREMPFILALPAVELYPNNLAIGTEQVLVHGIIDCFFEEDGEIVLVDYKSDANPKRHETQLAIYKKAVANATAMNVKEVLIYSFALGDTITLQL